MSSESNISHIIFNQMSENKYSSLIPTEGEFYVTPDYINLPLLTSMWFDHIVNDISWLRSDTFAWQSGDVYTAVYNHLVNDISGKTAVSETVGGVTISYYLADDGHKITTDETSVANIYTATGVAWYYVLDTTNHRFKLPRTKFGFTGLRDNVGNYVAPGLPNITGNTGNPKTLTNTLEIGTPQGALYVYSQTSNDYGHTSQGSSGRWSLGFDASRSNPIYGASTTVQPPATQMYLYFYVGNFTNSAIEQTAGITTAALNNKMDNDLGNSGPISDTFKTRLNTAGIRYVKETWQSGTSWYRIWNDGWIEQGGYTPRTADAFISVNFARAFSQDNPNVQLTRRFYYDNDSTACQNRTTSVSSVTKTGFKCYDNGWSSSGGSAGVWYACGY